MADLDARRAEVLGRAARIIQRQICTYIARKQFAELKRSATQLQSFVRGTDSSLYVEVLGRSIADVDFLFSSICTVECMWLWRHSSDFTPIVFPLEIQEPWPVSCMSA